MNAENLENQSVQRNLACRLVFVAILLSHLYAYHSSTLTHQMAAPVLSFLYLDPTFWIFWLTGITQGISSNLYLSQALDLALFITCILTIAFPSKRLYPFLFFLFYFLYFIIFNTYGAHHTLNKAGILLMPLAFIVKPSRFIHIWQGLRYYTVFIFASAFAWKLFRLSWMNTRQGELILKKNLVDYMYGHPESLRTQIYMWLITHTGVLQAIFIAGFLMEGFFIAGFFTRRFDRWLLGLMIVLVSGFWFMADAFFGELLIFGFTLPALKMLPSRIK